MLIVMSPGLKVVPDPFKIEVLTVSEKWLFLFCLNYIFYLCVCENTHVHVCACMCADAMEYICNV